MDCLVKTLKGEVSNDSIEKFGVFNVVVNTGSFDFRVGVNAGDVIDCDNAVDTINVGGSPVSFPYTAPAKSLVEFSGTATRKTTFKFDNLYNMNGFAWYSNSNIDKVEPADKVFGIGISGNENFYYLRMDDNFYTLDFGVFENADNLATVIINSNHSQGDISVFSRKTSLATLNLLSCNDVGGDIASLNGCTALTTLNIKSTDVIGTLESLVSGTSRTTGTLSVNCSAGVTLEGVAVGNGVTKTYNFATSTWS